MFVGFLFNNLCVDELLVVVKGLLGWLSNERMVELGGRDAPLYMPLNKNFHVLWCFNSAENFEN